MRPNNSVIWQLAHAQSPEERARLVDVFLLLAHVGDRIKALRVAREKGQPNPEMVLESEGGNG